MGFSLNFNDVFENGQIEDGTYEVVCTKAMEKVYNTGTVYSEFTLTIRNDIDQKSKNMNIWHKVVQTKDTGKYNPKSFNTLGKYFNLQNGKTYSSIDDLLNDFVGKCVCVKVKNEKRQFEGKEYEELNVKSFMPTNFPDLRHQFKDGQISPVTISIKDSDLPF